MNPRQDNVRGHLADDARIMPIACQPRIGFVAVGEQRGSTFHVGVYEGFDRGGGIVGKHREANAAGTRVEIFGVLASRFGLIRVALDDFDSPMTRILPAFPGSKNVSPSRKAISA